ncbi:MAG TPA: hypothetical protein VGH38_34105 [Bryobacteraceae bacterium]|jgi:hypothetical protein
MRRESSQPLTVDEHREMGREIRRTHARLRELCKVVVGIYGQDHRAALTFTQAVQALDRLSETLQAQAARDCPGVPTENFYV